ncbi:Modification methylase FokI [Sphingopyxis sp. LC81]|uniref:DNA adenine methylase n=1 Tax=Sphingopyxis sp. LC81 TaxID=1502850 RepID=UPI00050ED33B|nr:DNA adenine methylase [Sphingopyxis sp. LC81]KGB55032.1 Modification methylase FokI [Sphingopyxis sp. LC81]
MQPPYLKYMGSKRSMLQNGLGELITREVEDCSRFFDLFAGSAAVARFVGEKFPVPVVANDLQQYSRVLAQAILHRVHPLKGAEIWTAWDARASKKLNAALDAPRDFRTASDIARHREWSARQIGYPVTQSYGGHYFSAHQAMAFDAYRSTVSDDVVIGSVEIAAIIIAASQCVAAPGHTAQPFQPSATGIKFISEAWRRDPHARVRDALMGLAERHAKVIGEAHSADANELVLNTKRGDLLFIDPPYSGVHYSRFYHVLETIAAGECGEVSGNGRYPSREQRPKSDYSLKTKSLVAITNLLEKIAVQGASAIVTFPDAECSNGLSGEQVREVAHQLFRVEEYLVQSKFSSLGGRSDGQNAQAGRSARTNANEIIFTLRPA